MSVQRRSGRFFAYVVTAFAVLSSIGCHGPQIVDEYDRVADTRTLTLGPVDLEGVFFGEVHFTATIPDYVLEHKPADQVTAVFRYIDFQTLSMRADRRVIKAHRRLFADAAVTFTGEEFAAIATAGHLVGTLDGGSFDGETTDFTFSPGVRQQLRLFAEKALLVKPKRPRELEIPSPEVRLNTPARVERGSIQSPAAVSRIRDIQGRAHRSPMTGTDVAGVEGIVTRVERRGFYLQDPKSDGDPSTSEALFVFTRSAPAVRVGDEVVVDGRVTEFVPGGRSTGNLSTTQISSSAVRVSQRDQALPAAVVLGAAGRSPPRESVCDDAIDGDVEAAGGKFDPGADAIDFFESLEGMRVSIASATAIGPTTRYGEIWVRIEDSGRSEGEVRTSRDGLLRGPGAVNPDRVRVRFHRGSTRSLGVGARLERLVGVLGYSFGNFELLLEERASKSLIVRESALREESSATKTGPGVLTIATYNVWNLSAKNTSRMTRIANHIATNLDAPDIVALQEVQDDNGPENDTVVSAKKTLGDLVRAISKAGGPEYAIRQLDPADDADGGQPGGNIRVAYLYRKARVVFVDSSGSDGGFASPARLGVGEEFFQNSRKSLYGQFRIRGKTVHVVNSHLTSKYGSPPTFGRRQPAGDKGEAKRRRQAAYLRAKLLELVRAEPAAIVVALGDLNDYEYSRSVRDLVGDDGAFVNLIERLPREERYTYIYEGNAQVLDHIIVSRNAAASEVDVVHVNSEFPRAASDHDPVIARVPLGG